MEPTLEEQQEDSSQKQQQRQGILSRGINTLNNLRGANRLFSNPVGRIGSRIAIQTAARGFAAFLAGPGLPIAIAIIAVFIFTFIIVGFGGGVPSSEPATPTPAAP